MPGRDRELPASARGHRRRRRNARPRHLGARPPGRARWRGRADRDLPRLLPPPRLGLRGERARLAVGDRRRARAKDRPGAAAARSTSTTRRCRSAPTATATRASARASLATAACGSSSPSRASTGSLPCSRRPGPERNRPRRSGDPQGKAPATRRALKPAEEQEARAVSPSHASNERRAGPLAPARHPRTPVDDEGLLGQRRSRGSRETALCSARPRPVTASATASIAITSKPVNGSGPTESLRPPPPPCPTLKGDG